MKKRFGDYRLGDTPEDTERRLRDELRFDQNVARIRSLAEQRGVQFGLHGEAQDRAVQEFINELASALTVVEAALPDAVDVGLLAITKGRMLASLMLSGLDAMWVDIVDQVFAGDPLGEADEGLIAEVDGQLASPDAMLEARYQGAYRGIVELLAEESHVSLSDTEIEVVEQLAFLVASLAEGEGSLGLSLAEEAKAIILAQGVAMSPWWQRVLDLLLAAEAAGSNIDMS